MSADDSGTPRTDCVICPNCVHQFRATSEDTQAELTASQARVAELLAQQPVLAQAASDLLAECDALRAEIMAITNTIPSSYYADQALNARVQRLVLDARDAVNIAAGLANEIEELRGRLEVANLTYLGAASERDELKHDIERHVQIANEYMRDAERWRKFQKLNDGAYWDMRRFIHAGQDKWQQINRYDMDAAIDAALSPEERSGEKQRVDLYTATHPKFVRRQGLYDCRITAGTRADRRGK